MGFLSTGLWWAFFVPATASFSVYTLARRNSELGMKRLNLWGGLCGWICLVLVILTFIFSGWKGGLAVIIGMVLVSVILVQATRRIFVRCE